MNLKHSSPLGTWNIKVTFWGDSTTPMYKFTLSEPRKYWFDKVVWVQSLHRDDITHYTEASEKVINNYLKDKERWI